MYNQRVQYFNVNSWYSDSTINSMSFITVPLVSIMAALVVY